MNNSRCELLSTNAELELSRQFSASIKDWRCCRALRSYIVWLRSRLGVGKAGVVSSRALFVSSGVVVVSNACNKGGSFLCRVEVLEYLTRHFI